MSFVKKVKNLKPIVKSILEKEKVTRDCDKLLVLKVWAEQNPLLRHETTSFVSFSFDFIEGKYANFETITRARRQIQEENEHLRGDNYANRKSIEKDTRNNIND